MTAAPASPSADRRGSLLALASASISVGLAGALFASYFVWGSQLALAQAADSVSDVLGGAALAWGARASRRPADDEHPFGHGRAEPIAALVVAVLAGVLAAEVFRASVLALAEGAAPELDGGLALAFGAKVVLKALVVAAAARMTRAEPTPVVDAIRVDARNDVIVGGVAILGFLLARFHLPSIDAVLAMGVAIYVGYSGLSLARENIALLLGRAAPAERREELTRLALSTEGVRAVDAMVATWHGSELDVHVDIAVARELSLLEAHRIGHEVEEAIAKQPDVVRAVVHVGPTED